MAEDDYQESQKGGRLGEDLSWSLLEPAVRGLYADPVSMFLIQVKSDSPIGQELHNDPISVFKRIEGIPIDDQTDVRAMLLRANAELPANPVHRSEFWGFQAGSTLAAGVQFKHNTDQTQT
jgi:hypothetical protein